MIAMIGWAVFLIMFYCFARKGIKMFEHFLKKKAKSQADDELFKYMLERHGEAWAKSNELL